MKLTGNSILITGATSGIGQAFAEAFLKLDNEIIICGRRKDRLEQIKSRHPQIHIRQCDLEQAGLCGWLSAFPSSAQDVKQLSSN